MVKAYSVYCPPFDITSGGIRVMWALYGHLLAKGQIVIPNASFEGGDFVAIYPEIIQGNPFEAKHVVRYILNKPGVMSSNGVPGPQTFNPQDKIYVFSELFNTMGVNEARHMFLPMLDFHTWKNQGKKRTRKAVFVGKGNDTKQHPEECILINRNLAQDQQKLADLLNECQVMYQYDPVSAMSEIARLCGCPVVMLQDTYTRDDYMRKYEPGINGIGWGEQIPFDAEGFRSHYTHLKAKFSLRLDDFIEETQHD